MNKISLNILALFLGLAFVAAPAAIAGDSSRKPSKNPVSYQSQGSEQSNYRKACCQQSRCDRRCQRLLRMVQKRGCQCPDVYYALQPARAYTYLSRNYPPFRYSR